MTSPVAERRTPRLLLRAFVDDDPRAFAAINADPVVMEHYPAPLTRQQSDALVDRALGQVEVVSFTSATNVRSQAVMRRLGMTHDPRDDFDHPAIPLGHVLRRHVLYRWRPAPRPRAATASPPRTPGPPA